MFAYCTDKHKAIIEYIWIDGNNGFRSKTRVLHSVFIVNKQMFNDLIWNYDGSSTNQADSHGDTEVILNPCFICKNPLRKNDSFSQNYILLCDTYKTDGSPLPSNSRYKANKIFNSIDQNIEPWFGLEQEYFLTNNHSHNHIMNLINMTEMISIDYPFELTTHYCGSVKNNEERLIAETHLHACIEAGLTISGINAEVCPFQWEFQIGPVEGINAADSLIVARFLLERIAEKYGYTICYEPKPYPKINGSGCHINFSTNPMRKIGGIEDIHNSIKKLEKKQNEHIAVYGERNHLRLTGKCETADINTFSYGIGTRNTSIRIPNSVAKNGYGYFEDRRPAANVDPYLATSIIFETCCLT
jgi:glutamine synthetase